MRQQMEAERSARAEVLRSSGEAKAVVALANARKTAAVIQAEGEAEATTIRADAESGNTGCVQLRRALARAAGRGFGPRLLAVIWVQH